MNKRRWGCDGDATEPIEIDGDIVTRCPRRMIKDQPELSADLFWHYRRYDKGLLPEDGGLLSQPGKFMECMRVMEAAFHKVDVENKRHQDRKNTLAQQGVTKQRGNPYKPKVKPPVRRGRR